MNATKAKENKVLVLIRGGVVANVIVNNKNIKVLVVDADNDSDSWVDTDGSVFEASGSMDMEISAKVVNHYFKQF